MILRRHDVEAAGDCPSPSKITSPSPAALIVIGFSGVPLSVSDIDPSNGAIIGST